MEDPDERLNSQFTVVGAFWPPDAPDAISTGTLKADEQKITLTTAPTYSRQPNMSELLSAGTVKTIPVLHGFTQYGMCTLFQLMESDSPGLTDFSIQQSIKAASYRVSGCLMGMLVKSSDDNCLEAARYTFTGLSEWMPQSFSEEWEGKSIVLKLPMESQNLARFSLCKSQAEVSLNLFSQIISGDERAERVSRSVAYVEIKPLEAESLSWCSDIANRLENLFSLFTGRSVAMETIFVHRGKERAHLLAKRQRRAEPFDQRSAVRCTHSQLANAIAIWLCEPERFTSIEGLALGILRKTKLFIETEFLSLAQALEGFHRATGSTSCPNKAALRQLRKKLTTFLEAEPLDQELKQRVCESVSYANEPTLAARLADLCGRLSNATISGMNIHLVTFSQNIRHTRNFYTHAGSPQRRVDHKTPLSGKHLFLLNQKMRALLRGLLLLHVGIPEEQFRELVITEATQWV